ncbi:hypothetical protein EYF80_046461 [Liparis tanakae]|uniref:Uncharacterized protein n=1 Tax=Liparis tanakae TaxID=230148 RepID=A0A4Z2FQX7_9TELE|nr:hypothetical protein EYF80_046461 [Liparis tanakae]
MLSATSDTGARRGHSAAQTQGCRQTLDRNRSAVKSDRERERRRRRREGGGGTRAEARGERRLDRQDIILMETSAELFPDSCVVKGADGSGYRNVAPPPSYVMTVNTVNIGSGDSGVRASRSCPPTGRFYEAADTRELTREP